MRIIKIRKVLLSLGLAICLFMMTVLPAFAETFHGDSDWKVSFTQEEKMESNFRSGEIDEAVSGLQPGDNIIITLELQNDHSESTNWYMTNKVISSMEDRSSTAGGGAYTYKLTYKDAKGKENVLFDSDTVGGEGTSGAGEGLHQATQALENYFFLDTLDKNASGTITLEVALDGETQGNDYQDTLADLQMNFAVELNTQESTAPSTSSSSSTPSQSTGTSSDTSSNSQIAGAVYTGDDSYLPYVIVMGVSGLVILCVALFAWYKRTKKKNKEDA